MHLEPKREDGLEILNGKVISTEIVVDTLEGDEITKSKKMKRRTKERTSKRQEDREKQAKGKGIVRETRKPAQ